MARIDTCPVGHKLKLSIARAGKCDGCGRFVEDGERVQNCHACNWYLCDDCRPAMHNIGAAQDFWGAIANLFMGDVCSVPILGEAAGTELDYSRRRRSKKSKGVNKTQAESSDTYNGPGAQRAEAGDAKAASAPTSSVLEELTHTDGLNVEQQKVESAAGSAQPLDLLDDLDIFAGVKHQDFAHPPMSTAAIVGGA
mmetsp:Transcript_91803/g.230651  ORF Transcript_91803/g.230651 Transcript_91803/m.230651 type:complete len:196 (-) Transcript_91803:363-950(-)|eukprot:CAMPEP_0115226894 /NCGR_PEP_ID=MMETSP0270-20121206/30865_1 /TAXON_ID=71861 /ORGANISM="Scrippsiella trochoidea, Strain CCMP3099" /LENGTH=195 /DNA_ID=CAMNT_0002641329 /DNA_START=68 /DNA_END=655 /DNA_ORIENTATION=+